MNPCTFKKIYPFVWFTALVLMASCQPIGEKIVDKNEKALFVMTIIDNQKGSTDTAINYSYYLPKNYNGIDKLAIVFFLDPHAGGAIPVTKYAQLANPYNCILVGSNNIKNGQGGEVSLMHFQKLKAEIKNRFVIDENRIIISGFSGGAKLALIIAQQTPGIFGVVACGGSLPFNTGYQPPYYYAGIVGTFDFNYLEVQQTHTQFERQGFDFTASVFNGKHEWPPVENFEMALIGFEMHAIKTKKIQRNNNWLDGIWAKMNDSIEVFGKNNDLLNQYMYLKQTLHWFSDIKNCDKAIEKMYQLERSNGFNTKVNKLQRLIQTELTLRSEFVKAIDTNDLSWWQVEIEKIKKATQQPDNDVAQVSHRLLNYLSMASYMLVKTDLENASFANATKKLQIYEWVDPNNPDVYLMRAHLAMHLNDEVGLKQNFDKAKQLGFNDYKNYSNDVFWKDLMNNPELN